MPHGRSWKAIHRLYDRLRSKYFMDAEPPLMVPPAAKDLIWIWTAERAPYLGQTHFDEERDAFTVELNPMLTRVPRYMRMALLHEMTHMRNPVISCDGKKWNVEVVRLAQLGAIPL